MAERKIRLSEPSRDNLQRSVPFTVRDIGDNSDGLTLDGYAAVFNTPTEINSWEGRFLEKISPGAFKKTIRERTPRLQFDHGSHALIGSIPIGKISSLEEDARGLHVIARLADNWLIEPLRDALEQNAIDGMSFRFSVVREIWTDGEGKKITDPMKLMELLYDPPETGLAERDLKELKVSELGPVVWPAYEETSVGVRSQVTIDLANLSDRETRKDLARVIFLADAATRNSDTPNDDPEMPVDHVAKDIPQSPVDSKRESAPVVHLSSEEMRKKARRQRIIANAASVLLSIDKDNKNA